MMRTSDVCLLGIHRPNSRTERPRKTKIGTRDSDTTFKVKRSTCRGRVILWRPLAQLICICFHNHHQYFYRCISVTKCITVHLLLKLLLIKSARQNCDICRTHTHVYPVLTAIFPGIPFTFCVPSPFIS